MKLIIAIAMGLCSLGLHAQLLQASEKPIYEGGLGVAIRHTEGFSVPRASFAAHKLFRGFGLYTTFEYRGNVEFSDDFNGDGNYLRYVIGPTFAIQPWLYAYAGTSPFGPYGLSGDGGISKMRKELGLAYVHKDRYTAHLGYSNWVGFTLGLGYRFEVNK